MKKIDRSNVKNYHISANPLSVVCPVCKAAATAKCLFKVRDGHRPTDIPHAERVIAAQQKEDSQQRKEKGFSQNQVERQLHQLLEHSSKLGVGK